MGTRPENKPVIGIVGGIGAGKSTVANEFARLGCEIIDADRIGHELLTRPDIRNAIRRTWGDGVFHSDGRVNRETLGKIVFHHDDELAKLNALMHPTIGEEIDRQAANAKHRPDVSAVVVDAAVLFEAGWDRFCTDLVFVDAPEAERFRRIHESRNWDRETWQLRENSQIPLDKKRNRCDYIVVNSSSVPHLSKRIRHLFQKIMQLSDCP